MKWLVLSFVVGLLLAAAPAVAQESPTSGELAKLRKTVRDQNQTIQELNKRVKALEVHEGNGNGNGGHQDRKGQDRSLDAAIDARLDKKLKDHKAKSSWADMVKVKGNFRYRYEFIDDDRKAKDRNRNRIRARVRVEAELLPCLDLGFEISTGEAKVLNGKMEGDPISNNQTLSNAFSLKNLWVSQAYADLHPEEFVPGLHIIGGKIHRPFLTPGKSEVIWDADIVPEGGIIRYHNALCGLEVFANGYGFYVVERSGGPDTGMFGGQGALKYTFPVCEEHNVHVLGGGSYYQYTNLKGSPVILTSGGNPVTFGNTMDAANNYAENYRLINVFCEVGTQVVDIPVAFFGDWVENLAANEDHRAWSAGVVLGKTKKAGSWKLRYLFKALQKDSVFGTFTDSDFGGSGTNSRGHEVNFTYQVAKNWTVGASYFANETGISSDMRKRDFDRVQVDFKFKF